MTDARLQEIRDEVNSQITFVQLRKAARDLLAEVDRLRKPVDPPDDCFAEPFTGTPL